MLNYTAVGGDGIFDVLGKLFAAADAVNTSRGTTVPTKLAAAINQFKKDASATNAMNLAFADLPSSQASWQSQADSLLASLSAEAAGYLRGVVLRDAVQPADTIDNALAYLIRNMKADGRYVTPPTVGLSLAAGAGNSATDLSILFTTLRGDGQPQQNMLAEALALSLTSVNNGATLKYLGSTRVASLSQDWPAGSGTSRQVAAQNPDSSLLTNGALETVGVSNLPDGFILLDGVPGTDYLVTGFEVQRVAVSGGPTSGGYYLRFPHPNGTTYITDRLAFDANAAAVQTALRKIPGLSALTVSSTGATPNYTHDITFTGLAGNLSALTADNQTDAGSFTITEVTAGDSDAFRGRSLKVVGSAATHRRIYQALPTLSSDTVYFVFLRHKKTATPAAGTVRLAIVQGIGGSVTVDSAGNANSKTFNLTNTDVTTSYGGGWLSFRLKPSEAQPAYLEIDVQSMSVGANYFLDDLVVVAGSELYSGGPIVAAVSGRSAPIISDVWTLTATNNRGGKQQEWFDRMFDMKSRGYLLPTSGSTLLPDSLIS